MSTPGMVLTEDGLSVLVSRIEALAIRADRVLPLQSEIRDLKNELNRLRADYEAAEEKIGEWHDYATKLQVAINAIDPKGIKRKGSIMPEKPKPLEADIPF